MVCDLRGRMVENQKQPLTLHSACNSRHRFLSQNTGTSRAMSVLEHSACGHLQDEESGVSWEVAQRVTALVTQTRELTFKFPAWHKSWAWLHDVPVTPVLEARERQADLGSLLVRPMSQDSKPQIH